MRYTLRLSEYVMTRRGLTRVSAIVVGDQLLAQRSDKVGTTWANVLATDTDSAKFQTALTKNGLEVSVKRSSILSPTLALDYGYSSLEQEQQDTRKEANELSRRVKESIDPFMEASGLSVRFALDLLMNRYNGRIMLVPNKHVGRNVLLLLASIGVYGTFLKQTVGGVVCGAVLVGNTPNIHLIGDPDESQQPVRNGAPTGYSFGDDEEGIGLSVTVNTSEKTQLWYSGLWLGERPQFDGHTN